MNRVLNTYTQRYGSRAVYIVVAVNQNLFFIAQGSVQPFHRLIHIRHQERVMQIVQIGFKEFSGFFSRRNPSLNKQETDDRAETDFGCQCISLM